MDQTHLSFQRGQEAWLAEFEKWWGRNNEVVVVVGKRNSKRKEEKGKGKKGERGKGARFGHFLVHCSFPISKIFRPRVQYLARPGRLLRAGAGRLSISVYRPAGDRNRPAVLLAGGARRGGRRMMRTERPMKSKQVVCLISSPPREQLRHAHAAALTPALTGCCHGDVPPQIPL